jgi:hypothetical protein
VGAGVTDGVNDACRVKDQCDRHSPNDGTVCLVLNQVSASDNEFFSH